MYLGQLHDIAMKELKTGMSVVVIAIPGYYTVREAHVLASEPAPLMPDKPRVSVYPKTSSRRATIPNPFPAS